ncbi:unnamed protein product [Litomosoides sigmodontis]|uniref:Uncharacterized protein n=1 Tax=Litomosoides sigmodontis TaxID=42156 RepID=A0A3P6TEF2_LITSI|nr:unnamed protein product [Litomosoides sigmodontis]
MWSDQRHPTASNVFEDIESIELREEHKNAAAKKWEDVNFCGINEKVENLRKQLEKVRNDLPNQSSRKPFDSENEKIELLSRSRKLAGACKMLKSFLDVLESIHEVQTKDSDNMKLLVARSTTLTATVRQLLPTIAYT